MTVASDVGAVLEQPPSLGGACGGDATASSDRLAVANDTGAGAEKLEVDAAPPVAVATASMQE